jgi:hypothetical protein
MSSESDLSFTSPKRVTSKAQQESLTRIVKAQVTLLISSLCKDNYEKRAAEIHTVKYYY